ncbi:MAG: hypothetical protein ACE5JL_16290, partial [Dehalococcoidia bacterium]
MDWRAKGTAQVDPSGGMSGHQGRVVLGRGTGGLANIHGQLTIITDPVSGLATYSGQIHFD